jgi:hypothetical protein
MSEKTKKLSLNEWLKKLSSEGKEITVSWEGGNDSGCYYAHIDNGDLGYDDEYGNKLCAFVADYMEYGSFAGEFSTTGKVFYDPAKNAFIGDDDYYQDESRNIDCKIPLKISKELWFDSLNIDINTNYAWEEYDIDSVDVRLVVNNGPIVDLHSDTEETLKKYIYDEIVNLVTSHFSLEGIDNLRNIHGEYNILFNTFKEEGDYRIGYIKSIDCTYEVSNYKDVYIELEDDL